jgi:hypothetical protein
VVQTKPATAANGYVKEQRTVHPDIGEVFEITITLSDGAVELSPIRPCNVPWVDGYDQ